jgi:hypothetical protein
VNPERDPGISKIPMDHAITRGMCGLGGRCSAQRSLPPLRNELWGMRATTFSRLLFRGIPESGAFVLHDPISVAKNNESALNPRLILETLNRGSERTLCSTCTPLFLSHRAGRRAVSVSL